MATSLDYVQYVAEQIEGNFAVRYRKMFGEYMIYCNDKPVLLLCDDTVFVKILPETTEILGEDAPSVCPYEGAKPHYVVDPDDRERFNALVAALEAITPIPKKKKQRATE